MLLHAGSCRAAFVAVGMLGAAAVPHVVSQTLEGIHTGVAQPLQGQAWINPHADESHRDVAWHLREAQVSDTLEAECVSNLEEADGVAALCTGLGGWLPYTHAWVSGGRFVAADDHLTGVFGFDGVHAEERVNGALTPRSWSLRDARVGGYPVGKGLTEAAFDEKQEDLAGFGERVNLIPDAGLRDQDIRVEVSITASERRADTDALAAQSVEICSIPGGRNTRAYCFEGGGPYTVTARVARRDGRVVDPTQDRTYEVSYHGGSATEGQIVNGVPVPSDTDFQSFDPFTITVPRGAREGRNSFLLELYDDSDTETDETIEQIVHRVDTSIPVAVNTLTIYILDDDSSYLLIPQPVNPVYECAGYVSVPIVLVGQSEREVTVDYLTAGVTGVDSATSDADYTPVESTLTFSPGETEKTVRIDIVADEIPANQSDENENSLEYFGVVMRNPVNARFIPSPSSPSGFLDHAFVQINDESCVPQLQVENASAEESDGTIVFDVTLNNFRGSAVEIDYQTIDGSASSGADYEAKTGTVEFSTQNTTGTVGTQRISVALLDDSVSEAIETFQVNFTSSTHPVLTASATGTIVDDDDVPDPVISITGEDAVTEGETATFTITAEPVPAAALTVTLEIAQEGDFVGTDDLGTQTVEVGTGGTKTYTVSTISDNVDEPSGSVTATLQVGTGYTVADPPDHEASVNVVDDDTPDLVLSPTSLEIPEGSTGSYTVKLATQPTGTVTLNITGNANTDLKLSENTLTFTAASWSIAQTVTVTAEHDDDATNDAATLAHTASGGGYGSVNKALSVTVTDDDTPDLVLSPTSLEIPEGSTGSYTVKLATQPTGTVTVSITGNANTDLKLNENTLIFTTATWSTAQSVSVTAEHDDDATNDAATLAHTASGGGYGSVNKTLSVTVIDDDTPGLRIAPTALTVLEGTSGMYRVALQTQPTGTVMVTIGSDNSDVTMVSTSLTFTPSDWATDHTVTVRAAEDADTDDDSATLMHTASGGDYESLTGVVTVAVKDNDSPAGLVVSPVYLTVTEGMEERFTVRLLTEPTQAVDVRITDDAETDVTVNLRTLRYTSEDWSTPVTVTVRAEEDDDVVGARVQLTLTASGGEYDDETEEVVVVVQDNDIPGIVLSPTELEIAEEDAESYTARLMAEPSGTVIVKIASDSPEVTLSDASLTFATDDWYSEQTIAVHADQDDDTVNGSATLTHRASGGGYDGVAEELMVTVLDDDEADLVVSPQALSLGEGTAGKTFTVRLATMPSEQVTVSIFEELALNRKVSVDPQSVTFTHGDWSARQTVTVNALADADGADEFGKIQLSASGGDYSGESGSVAIDVRDDDAPHLIRLASSLVLVSEGAGPARFKVRLNRQSTTAVTVRYRTQDGSAWMGADYEQTSGVLTFAAGDLEKEVPVQIIDDALHEEDETFTLELSDAQGAQLGNATGRATITDNDAAPTVSIVPAAYVREGGIASVYLSLSNASSEPVMVPYSTRDMTAIAGEDYKAVSAGSVTIEPSEMEAVIQVPTRNDTVHEGREAFLVQLDGGGQTTVTILDNDRLPQLSIGDVTVSEDGGRAKLAVSLSGTSAVRVGVAYATQDGTAKAGADYTRTMGTLVFASGETVRHIWVPVVRDDVVEEDEGLVLKLSAPEHAVLLDAEGNVTIKDDPIEVSIHDGTGTENSEELVMAVRLSFSSTKVVSVQFAVIGGTATSDVDYEATEGLVVFETGSTEAQVRIPLIDDDLQEGDETIEVRLSNPTNVQIGQAMATGTIVDDDTAPGVQVRAIAVSQTEALFVVGLLAPVAERLTGRYRTVDGTAWAGEDYERMEGVLEFGPGETRKEVRVPLLRAQGSGEAFALMVELGDETVREEVVLGSKDTGNRARLGRSVAVHIVEAVSERMEGSLVGCMPRPFPGQRVRASHLLSGCGMQAGGERLSVWGRGAYSRLQSGGISGADVVTASLGADYRTGGRWLMGMAVSRSEALEQEGTLLQMTGWYPYVRYGGMRHSVWGLAGAGQGVVAEAADTGMRMMAAGVGGTLVRRAGARLGYEADGFWLGMDGGIGVSRVRAGLEGSVTLQDILEPYMEAVVLHSGGDAERGMGMEAGGGLRVRMGMLHAEVMSRRLVLHQEDGYGEWGYAGMVRYGGLEGLGAQVRPTWGRTHVETLWQAERPWEVYPADRRLELEVGYGSRVRRRSLLRPHVGMGLRGRGRDYRIGAGVQGLTGLGFSVSGLAMEHMAPYRPVSYGVTASGYMRW